MGYTQDGVTTKTGKIAKHAYPPPSVILQIEEKGITG